MKGRVRHYITYAHVMYMNVHTQVIRINQTCLNCAYVCARPYACMDVGSAPNVTPDGSSLLLRIHFAGFVYLFQFALVYSKTSVPMFGFQNSMQLSILYNHITGHVYIIIVQ